MLPTKPQEWVPSQTPLRVREIARLWSGGSALTMTPDSLLAQGLISFSELRNNSLPARWFCLYGWDPEEAGNCGKDPGLLLDLVLFLV